MKKILAICLFLLTVHCAVAQTTNDFVAFSLKGKVTYKNTAKDKDWTAVKVKTPLYKGGTIKLEKGAEIVLLHKGHTTVKIDKPGQYTIEGLIKEAEKTPKDETSAYLEFIWKEFNKHHDDAESYHREYMTTKGGVDREGCQKPIMTTPGLGEKIYAKNITFTWESNGIDSEYVFIIYDSDIEDTKLLELTVKGNSITLGSPSIWVKQGRDYYWVAYPKGKPNCARFSFTLLKEEEYNAIIKKGEEMYAALKKTAINAIKTASYFEDNGLMEEAGKYYFKAIELSGQADEYKIIYGSWLARAGRVEEAQKWWVKS